MEEISICPWCNLHTTIIWVHGHGQCSNCGLNIDECCRGEQCESEEIKPESPDNTDE